MKRAISAALLCCVAQIALAQTPPTLPDGTTLGGHITAAPGQTGVPTVAGASCGTPVLTAGSSDTAGQFQAKGIATCALTFGKAFASQPFCIVQDQTTPADSIFSYSTSGTKTTGFVVTATVLNDFVNWLCIGQQGN